MSQLSFSKIATAHKCFATLLHNKGEWITTCKPIHMHVFVEHDLDMAVDYADSTFFIEYHES